MSRLSRIPAAVSILTLTLGLALGLPLSLSRSHASATGPQLEAKVREALPSALRGITPGATTRAQVEKLFGKPMEGSGIQEQYYRLAPGKADSNDLTVGYEARGQTVRYFYYRLPYSPSEGKYPLNSFTPLIPKKALQEAEERTRKQAGHHEAGRVIEIRLPEKGLMLQFNLAGAVTLRSVIAWKPGDKMP